jgi:hypothetical protein
VEERLVAVMPFVFSNILKRGHLFYDVAAHDLMEHSEIYRQAENTCTEQNPKGFKPIL